MFIHKFLNIMTSLEKYAKDVEENQVNFFYLYIILDFGSFIIQKNVEIISLKFRSSFKKFRNY